MKRFKFSFMCGLSLFIYFSILSSPVQPQTEDPAYMSEPWVRTGGPIGGLGYDIRYNFADPTIWYVTDDWSGFHMSTDNGLTWTRSNEGITSRKVPDGIPVFCVTVDQHNPNILWLGTDGPGDIFKSYDGGHSWVLMRNGIDPNLLPMAFRGFTVDPRTSDIVYAMGEIASPAWTPDGSERKGLQFDMTKGIVYKTTNGGQNWTEIWRGNNLARYCWIHPYQPDTLYISTGIFDREAANTDTAAGFAGGVGILKSTDGGATWRVFNQANGLLDLYVGSLYMNPDDPDMLLAAASQDDWSGYSGEFTGGVYLTEDGGETWTRVLSSETGLITVVEYSVSHPSIAYAAGIAAVYRSEDAGHTWQQFQRPNGTWGPEGIVAGIPIDMQCDPNNPMRVFVNNYLGGNFLSTDGGESWILASDGYTGALVHHVTVVNDNPAKVYVGSRSGVYRSDNAGQKWFGIVYPPEGMVAKFNEITALALDPSDSNHLLTIPADFTTVLYSYDGGQYWQIGETIGIPFDIVFAPSEPSTVYASTDLGLYVSNDGGASFLLANSVQVSSTAIAVHPSDAKTVYIATSNGELLKTTDGGLSATTIGAGLPSLPVFNLAIDPSNPVVLFGGGSSYGGKTGGLGGVYRSTDGGLNWVQSSAGIEPNAKISSVVVDPTNGQIVYAADFYSGVYASTDGGGTWHPINEGLDQRSVNTLALSNSGTVLYAGVEGGGVYRLGEPAEPSAVGDVVQIPEDFRLEQNYPNPFNPITNINYSIKKTSFVEITIYNSFGQKIKTIVRERQSSGNYRVPWDGRDENGLKVSSGVYSYQMLVDGNMISKKMLFIK